MSSQEQASDPQGGGGYPDAERARPASNFTCPTLETERLILRPFEERDVDAYTETLQSDIVRYSLRLPDTVGRYEAWLSMAQMLGQWALRNTGNWALERKTDGAFVGRAGPFRPERADWPGIEVGWTLHPDFHGQGYATEAGRASVTWAFANHDVDAIYSCILATNLASQAVARRLGMKLFEDRVLSHYSAEPHGIWRVRREDYDAT